MNNEDSAIKLIEVNKKLSQENEKLKKALEIVRSNLEIISDIIKSSDNILAIAKQPKGEKNE